MKSRGASLYFFFPPPWCSAAADNTQHHGTLLSWFFSSAYKAAATARVQWAMKSDQISVRPRAFCPVCIKYFSTQVVMAGLRSVVVWCVRCNILTWAASPLHYTWAVQQVKLLCHGNTFLHCIEKDLKSSFSLSLSLSLSASPSFLHPRLPRRLFTSQKRCRPTQILFSMLTSRQQLNKWHETFIINKPVSHMWENETHL